MTKRKPRLRRKQAGTEVIAFRATAEEIRAAVGIMRQKHPDKVITRGQAFRELALSREDVRLYAQTNWLKGDPK